MKYLIAILLILGCISHSSSSPKNEETNIFSDDIHYTERISTNTLLYNEIYIILISDLDSSNTFSIEEFQTNLVHHKDLIDYEINPDYSNDLTLALAFKTLNNTNLIINEIFGNNILKLESNVYKYKDSYLVITYDPQSTPLKPQDLTRESIIEHLKYIKREMYKNNESEFHHIFINNLSIYKIFIEEAEMSIATIDNLERALK